MRLTIRPKGVDGLYALVVDPLVAADQTRLGIVVPPVPLGVYLEL